MVQWVRLLHSGLTVSYNDLPFKEVVALAMALDEWDSMMKRRYR